MASKTLTLTPSISSGGEGGKRERSSSISLGVGVTSTWGRFPLKAERELHGEGVSSLPISPLILSMSGMGLLSDLRALINCALSPNVVVLWSDDREEDVVAGGGWRRDMLVVGVCGSGEVSSMIWLGDEWGVQWAVAGEDILLSEGSGDLTPDTEQSITVVGGGGMNSGGVEFSLSDICPDPVEFVATTVDPGGVRVAIDILEEMIGGIILHCGVLLRHDVLILLSFLFF